MNSYAQLNKKRARKKFASHHISKSLIKANPDSPLLNSYIRTLACSGVLQPDEEGILHAHYCKNRWCPVCQSIRIATLINGYKPQLEALADPYFVTLTRPTCTADELPYQIKLMNKIFRQIKQRRAFRNVSGIRKAECTTRPDDLYHYHFHIIIEGKENAECLIKSWLELNPESHFDGQDMKKADCGSLIELFKYFTKLFAKDQNTGERLPMDFKRLDIIFQALSGKRIFQPFGKMSPVTEDIPEEGRLTTELKDLATQSYKWVLNDWYGFDTGTPLTGYEPSEGFIHLFDIDNTLKD